MKKSDLEQKLKAVVTSIEKLRNIQLQLIGKKSLLEELIKEADKVEEKVEENKDK